MLTNRKGSFYNSMAIETGLSDCHRMTLTVFKMYVKKKEPRYIKYTCYKNINEIHFRLDLLNCFEVLEQESINYDNFLNIFSKVLNIHAPLKKKII